MKKILFVIFTGSLLISCNQKTNTSKEKLGEHTTTADSLTAELQKIHDVGLINGFAVAIVNQDSVLYTNGFGFADVATQKKYTKNTVQNIASVSKTLIGIALLKAQELGKLSLNDPINKHLPFTVENPYFPNEPITIRQLATHTSSITDTEFYNGQSYILKDEKDTTLLKSFDIGETFNLPQNKISINDYLEHVLSQDGKWYLKEGFLNKKPGELFEYTNVGATLAALVLEYATGDTYDAFTKKYILKPLKMNSSGWSFEQIDLENHTTLYADPSQKLPYYSLITYPDGGLITSSEDLGKYLSELIKGYSGNGTLLSKESYAELFSEQLEAGNFEERDAENPYDDEYNSGIFMGFSAQGYVGHTGGDPGVATFMFFDAEKKLGRLLLINTGLNNKEGVQQFFSIWDTLKEYQEDL